MEFMTEQEKQRRREIKRELKRKEQAEFEALLPASKDDLRALFEYVGNSEEACDHTLKDSLTFIRDRGLPKTKVMAWLEKHGGHCDCEVISNVEDKWLQMVEDDGR